MRKQTTEDAIFAGVTETIDSIDSVVSDEARPQESSRLQTELTKSLEGNKDLKWRLRAEGSIVPQRLPSIF